MKKSLIILLCLTTLLTTGCGKVPELENGEQLVVEYTDGSITADEFYEVLKNKYGRDVLIEMIDSKLLNAKYPDDSEFESLVDSQVEYFKAQTGTDFLNTIKYYYGLNSEEELREFISLSYKQEKLTEEYIKANITDEQIQEFYDNEIYGDITASHILITPDASSTATEEEQLLAEAEALEIANEIIAKLNAGEDFAELAKEYSDDTGSASEGGSVGEFNITSNLVDEFKDGAKDLEVGKYTLVPVKSSFGYHIILKESQKEKAALDSIKDVILDFLYEEVLASDELIASKMLEQFRIDMGINIHDDNLLSQYNSLMKQLEEA